MHRTFKITLPSGESYWTVVDESYQQAEALNDYLLGLRLGMDRAESTTRAYAKSLALFTDWRLALGISEKKAVKHLGQFIYWLQQNGDQPTIDAKLQKRSEKRINAILTAVRGYYNHRVAIGEESKSLLDALYQENTGRGSDNYHGTRRSRRNAQARHRLKEPVEKVQTLEDEQVLALMNAASNSRDRFLIVIMWRMGLRRGEVLGLRLEDVHFTDDSRPLGCSTRGSHLHVKRRNNANGATAKSRQSRIVPADRYTVQFHDIYMSERAQSAGAASSEYLFVNLYAGKIGSPMRLDSLNKLIPRLAKTADIGTNSTPHILRHSFSTNAVRAGVSIDTVADLLGHSSIESTQIYLHASEKTLREAVNKIARSKRDSKEF